METRDKEERADVRKGPAKGDFIAPPELTDTDERTDALPQQEEFWRPPVRFGSVPVEKEPLGWDRRKGFRKLFPQVMLPFQVVDRVPFGHSALEPNQLFWGDNALASSSNPKTLRAGFLRRLHLLAFLYVGRTLGLED